MAFVTGGELVVRELRRAGVEKLFALHGANIDTIFQSCLDHGLPIVDTRHEMNAGHAAEGYARVTRGLPRASFKSTPMHARSDACSRSSWASPPMWDERSEPLRSLPPPRLLRTGARGKRACEST